MTFNVQEARKLAEDYAEVSKFGTALGVGGAALRKITDMLTAACDEIERVNKSAGVDDFEQIVTCLEDDAARLLDANPDDEIAHNMQQAAALIHDLRDCDKMQQEKRRFWVEFKLQSLWAGAENVDTFSQWICVQERIYGMEDMAAFCGAPEMEELCKLAAEQCSARAVFAPLIQAAKP